MREFCRKYRQELLEFGVLFGALLLRLCFFGAQYYPQLDDYIQHRPYPVETDFWALAMARGLFASRPLAGISDFFLWGQMPFFAVAVAMAVAFALSGVLFQRLFHGYFGTGVTFLVVYAMLPAGMEGTYWLAASTRIVPPLLFCALALTAFDRFCRTGSRWKLTVFLVWAGLSFCFYEQVLVLSLALNLMLMLLQVLRGQRRAWWGLLIFLPAALYALVTGYFSAQNTGELSTRMGLLLPWQAGYFTTLLPSLLWQLVQSFLLANVAITGRGLLRGAALLVQKGVFAGLLIPLVVFGIYRIGKGREMKLTEGMGFAVLFGFLAALAPVIPFFLLANPWFCLRNIVPSFVGLGLLADCLVRRTLRERSVAVAAVLAAVCMVASVSEVYDHRQVSRSNERVAQAILAADDDWTGSVGIVGLNQNYLPVQNYFYHDHVLSSHASDWALTGLLRYYAGGGELAYQPTPLATDEEFFWKSYNKAMKDVTAYDSLYLYDHDSGTLLPLRLATGAGETRLLLEDGRLWALIWEDDEGRGHIDISQP